MHEYLDKYFKYDGSTNCFVYANMSNDGFTWAVFEKDNCGPLQSTFMDYINYLPTERLMLNTNLDLHKAVLFVVERSANMIAKNTLRGRGNHVLIIDDKTFCVFYKGTLAEDTPFAYYKDKLYINPAAYSYFKKFETDLVCDMKKFIELLEAVGSYKVLIV